MTAAIPRVGARVLLLDPAGRVLLIHERIEGGTHWITPGGGVEPGEELRVAAAREVWEETGLRIELPADPALHVQRRGWSWQGASYDQTDHFFLARVPAGAQVAPRAPTAMEQQTLIGHRWWSERELRAAHDRFEPPELAELVERLATAQPRRAGRVLLFDARGRVLLILSRTDVGSDRTHWITPGGGVDDGETTSAAAVRELEEEVGVRATLATEPAFRNRELFTFDGRSYDQVNDYFPARLPSGARPRLGLHTEAERVTLLDLRWWTSAELRATAETVWPVALADEVDRLRDRLA